MTGPKRESYMECPICTKEAGEPVVYHKSSLTADEADLFDDTKVLKCPKGHVVKEEA